MRTIVCFTLAVLVDLFIYQIYGNISFGVLILSNLLGAGMYAISKGDLG